MDENKVNKMETIWKAITRMGREVMCVCVGACSGV